MMIGSSAPAVPRTAAVPTPVVVVAFPAAVVAFLAAVPTPVAAVALPAAESVRPM
jgi:hypothetical protein